MKRVRWLAHASEVVVLVVPHTCRGIWPALHSKALSERHYFLLQHLVPLEQVLDCLVAVLAALHLLQLPLQALNVLLCAGSYCSLGFSVVGSFPGEL